MAYYIDWVPERLKGNPQTLKTFYLCWNNTFTWFQTQTVYSSLYTFPFLLLNYFPFPEATNVMSFLGMCISVPLLL